MPFGWLYGTIASVRNRLYDRGVLPSYQSGLKSIVIGNLQLGGSGKTPHTAFIYDLLKDKYKIAILSRGYGRKTKGLVVADEHASAESIGDESYWYFRNFKDALIVVSESRKKGLQYLEKQNIDLVLLDDAYQHRAVSCTLNIMLTDYKLPYYKDHVVPYGRLREWKTGDDRAHIIIVTKCPQSMSLEEKVTMIQNINPYDYQQVFFTNIKASEPYAIKGQARFESYRGEKIVAMSGIANPANFIATCSGFGKQIIPLSFNDHHDYTVKDIQKMLNLMDDNTAVLVTEKDAVKLVKPELFALLPKNKIFALPIRPDFLFNETEKFNRLIRQYLK